MDIEQLKLILETVGMATSDAKDVAVWYLAFKLISDMLLIVGVSILGVTIYKTVTTVSRINNPERMTHKGRLVDAARTAWLYDNMDMKLYQAVKEYAEDKS